MRPKTIDLRDLMAHGAWLRRIARELLRDGDEADDAVAETWLAAHRHGPSDEGPPRPWLARVVTNLARNRLRAARRRQVHETQADPADSVPTPEAMTAALELQRRLSSLMEALAEPYRQVVYLRYVEDLAPVEIAARLGLPGGTVRWRLKTGLDILRRQLDEAHGGDRRRWAAALGGGGLLHGTPGAGEGSLVAGGGGRSLSSSVAGAGGRRGLLALAAASFAGVVALGLLGWRQTATPPSAASPAAGAALDRNEPKPPPPGPRPVAVQAVAVDCPQARALAEEVAMRERELAPRRPFETTFRNSSPNPVAERRFGALLAEAYQRAGLCTHRLECRGLVCRIETLVPRNTDRRLCRSWPPGVRFNDYLNRWRLQQAARELYREAVDSITGERLDVSGDYYQLATATGDPVPEADQPPLPAIAPGRHRPRPPLPRELPPGCREQAEHQLRALRQLEREGDRHLPLPEQFDATAADAPDPALEALVTTELRARLGPLSSPLAIRCRSLVCRIDPPPPAEWFQLLSRHLPHSSLLAASWFRTGSSPQPPAAFLRVYPPDQRQLPSARSRLCGLAARARREALLDRCAIPRVAAGQKVDLDLDLDPGDDPGAPATLSVSVTGPHDTAPFVECLSTELRALADRLEPQPSRDKLRSHIAFQLPPAPRLWNLGPLCPP